VCDLESIVTPSIFNVIRSVAGLETMFPILDLICEENTARRMNLSFAVFEDREAALCFCHVCLFPTE
jgi:hypothetical protein